jgi:hypothetical protein
MDASTTNHPEPIRGAGITWAAPAGASSAVAQHLVGRLTAGASLKTAARTGFPWPAVAALARAQGSGYPLSAPLRPDPPPRGR